MKGIRNGWIWHNNSWLSGHVLIFDQCIYEIVKEEEVLEEASVEWTDAKGLKIVPGFIDVHIHGYKGHDVMNDTSQALVQMARGLPENGVTSFLATTVTGEADHIGQVLNEVQKTMKKAPIGAEILGVHLEGPFINPLYKGAQNQHFIQLPHERWLETYGDILKIITCAPELEGMMEIIAKYNQQFCFSIGHSNCTFEQTQKAFDLGVQGVTHLFNGMAGLHHRAPGIVGASLVGSCYCEVIADNHHIRPELYPLILKTKGIDKIILITDCIQGGGLSEGGYDLGGLKVTVEDGRCTLESGVLAGSVLRLNQGARHFQLGAKCQLEEVIPMITENPARYLGIEGQKGGLVVGFDADIVIMDDQFNVYQTFAKGKCVYP